MNFGRLGGVAALAFLLALPVSASLHAATLAQLEAGALSGDAGAALKLGERYEHAEGVSRDYGRALALYCVSARAGDAQAAYNIGWMYLNGRGVPRDDALAGAWLKRAAKAGHEHAGGLLRHFPAGDADPDATCPRKQELAAAVAAVTPPVAPKQVAKLVRSLAPKYGLDPALVIAVIAVESAFRADAVSAKNAQGLMQLIPETAERFGVRDAFDMADNIKGGMSYLRWLIRSFEGDLTLALAAYNAGEGAVARYGGVPPYPETQAYVKKLAMLYPLSRHPF